MPIAPVRANRKRSRIARSPVRWAKVGDIKLGYRQIGEGPPLVMIIGSRTPMAAWDPDLLKRLAKTNQVIVFDNRGVATSTDRAGSELTITQMADDTAELIKSLGLSQANVLGWSMGGNIAAQLALKHPELIDNLILVCTDPGSQRAVEATPEIEEIADNASIIPIKVMKLLFPGDGRAAFAYLARTTFQRDLRIRSFWVNSEIIKKQQLAQGPLWYCEGCGVYQQLHQIQQPTLVIGGEKDLIEPPVNSKMMANLIPNARLEIFKDAGHGLPFHFRGKFVELIRQFLEQDQRL